jgi:pimeloyl-ACP methyl ester carboxylesterase
MSVTTTSTHRTGTTTWEGHVMRWSEDGDPDGPLVLLLHGIYAGAHGYEWRRLVPELVGRARVRIPDLLGADRSDRPDLAYDPAVVSGVVRALIEDAGPAVHVVASSLTGTYALRVVAAGTPVGSLTLITPSGMGAPREGTSARGAQAIHLLRRSPLGRLVVRGLTSAPSVRWFQRNQTYADPAALTEAEVVETRRAGRLPGAEHLQLAFVFGRLAIDVDPASVAAVRPLVVWAHGQGFVDDAERDAWSRAGATVVDVASGLPQVEEPAHLASVLPIG